MDLAVGDPTVACGLDGDKLAAVGFVGLYVAVFGGWHNGIAFHLVRRLNRCTGRVYFPKIFPSVKLGKWTIRLRSDDLL